MKIVSWGIVFIIVIFSFSFINRTILVNKMEVMQDEVRYNNALEQATVDSTDTLLKQMTNYKTHENETYYMILNSMDKFFESFSVSLGYYGGETKKSALKIYVPAIVVLAHDGMYICSLETIPKTASGVTEYYMEHVLKTKIPYACKIGNCYVNFTLDNKIKVLSYKTNEYLEGTIVDTRHYNDIKLETYKDKPVDRVLGNGDVVTFLANRASYSNIYTETATYKGKELEYLKTFQFVDKSKDKVKYLYEEWSIDNSVVQRRTTEYTDKAYEFTKLLEDEYEFAKDLTQGNPENDGFIDPFTGSIMTGKFHQVRREKITNSVTEKLAVYVKKHNKFTQMNNVAYVFKLPTIQDTDWSNAIHDVSIFAFVQGIQMHGESYYNNYGLSGARIVRSEKYYALPGHRNKNIDGIAEDSDEFPKYYSSYSFLTDNQFIFENMKAKIFENKYEAANAGYFPYIRDTKSIKEKIEYDVSDLDIKCVIKNKQPTRDSVTIDVTINDESETKTYISECKYMRVTSGVQAIPSAMEVLGKGMQIESNFANKKLSLNVFENGTYIVAAIDENGLMGISKTILVDNIEKDNFEFTVEDIPVSDAKHKLIVSIANDSTPTFAKIDVRRKEIVGMFNLIYFGGANISYDIPITRNGEYTILVYSACGQTAKKIIEISDIDNNSPKVEIKKNPNNDTMYMNQNMILEAEATDPEGDTLTYKWFKKQVGKWIEIKQVGKTLTILPKDYIIGDNEYMVRVEDSFGNKTEATTSFNVINENAPNIVITTPKKIGNLYDIQGNGISTTFNNNGYSTVLRVNSKEHTIDDGISVTYTTKKYNGSVRIIYHIKNSSATNKYIDLATHADIEIGINDNASIYDFGGTLIMTDGETDFYIYLCDTDGVDDVTTYWFGRQVIRFTYLWDQVDAAEVIDSDSGIAFSWQNKLVKAGETLDLSYIIGM